MTRLIAVTVALVVGSCASEGRDAERAERVARCLSAPLTDLRQEPDYTVDHLHRWRTENGCEVRLDVLATSRGKGACGGPRTAGLFMTWPLGSTDTEDGGYRNYIKDPEDVFGDRVTARRFRADFRLPRGARDTGFSQTTTELWMVPRDDSFVYLVTGDDVERWPLDEEPPGCG